MQNSKKILVSIIIPMFNAVAFIEKTVNSLIQQSLVDIEIIIVDDYSEDGSYELVSRLSLQDSRIQIIKLNENYGSPSHPRNVGVSHANGEFIGFVDADDTVDTEMYEKMYIKAVESDSDIVVCGYKEIDENGKLLNITVFNEQNPSFSDILRLDINPATWNKIYRRELFNKHNIKFQHKIFCEDLGNTHELFYFAKKITLIKEPLYNYLVASQGASQQSINKKYISDIFKALETNKEFLLRENIFVKNRKAFFKRYITQLNIINNKLYKAKNESLIVYFQQLLETIVLFNSTDLKYLFIYEETLFINYLAILKIHKIDIKMEFLTLEIENFLKYMEFSLFLDLQIKIYALYKKGIKELYIYGYGAAFIDIKVLLLRLNIKILGVIETTLQKRILKYPYGTIEMFIPNINNKYILIISSTYRYDILKVIEELNENFTLSLVAI